MVSTVLTRARRSNAALALDPLPASKVQPDPRQFAELDTHNSKTRQSAQFRKRLVNGVNVDRQVTLTRSRHVGDSEFTLGLQPTNGNADWICRQPGQQH